MASRLSCFTPSSKKRTRSMMMSSPRSSCATFQESPRLALSFVDDDPSSPGNQQLITDEEMRKLLSSPDSRPQLMPSMPDPMDTDADTTLAIDHNDDEQVSFEQFLREDNLIHAAKKAENNTATGDSQIGSPPKKHKLISRSKTLTALPTASTGNDLAAAAQVPRKTQDTTTGGGTSTQTKDPSRKRKQINMSIAYPFGSIRRIFGSDEPEFEMLTPPPRSTPRQKKTTDPDSLTMPILNPHIPTNYMGAPKMTPQLPVPTLARKPPLLPSTNNPSKAELHTLIIKLQSRVADLNIENQVLRDQINIVRKDWMDVSGELEAERMKAWQSEMERFRLGVRVQELVAELASAKRGSSVL